VITQLGLKNFKSFGREQKIPIKPITLIFGANSSGKSSILQSLLVLNQTLSNKNKHIGSFSTNGSHINLGSFENVVYGHHYETGILISVASSEEIKGLSYNGQKEPIYAKFDIFFEKSVDGMAHIKTIDFGLSCDNDFFIRYESEKDNEYFSIKEIRHSKILEEDILRINKIVGECEFDNTKARNDLAEAVINNFHNELHYFFETSDYQIKLSGFSGTKHMDDMGFSGRSLKMVFSEKRTRDKLNIFSHIGDLADTYFTGFSNNKSYEDVHSNNGLELIPIEYRRTKLLQKDPLLFAAKEYQADNWRASNNGKRKKDVEIKSLKANAIAFRELLKIFVDIDKIVYSAPIRSLPKRYHVVDRNNFEAQAQDSSGDRLAETLFKTKGLKDEINVWLKKLDIPYVIDVSCHEIDEIQVYRISLEDIYGVVVSLVDVGFGISQVLPIIINALTAKDQLTLMEQPEIHLHPKLQTELSDLLIHSAKYNNNTIIAETHSEHLILRLLKRVRQTANGDLPEGIRPITPDDIAILYVDPQTEGAKVIELPVNEDGEFDKPWPGGFFAERSEELI